MDFFNDPTGWAYLITFLVLTAGNLLFASRPHLAKRKMGGAACERNRAEEKLAGNAGHPRQINNTGLCGNATFQVSPDFHQSIQLKAVLFNASIGLGIGTRHEAKVGSPLMVNTERWNHFGLNC
tara:strand:+ start:467 stop:838 length:372 start_codon:yes stop_codon:yes gene_type:complete